MLIGRDREIGALSEVLQNAREGPLQHVVLSGEAGIGKTAILQRAIGVARDMGFHVHVGTAEEMEAERPFGPFVDALSLHTRSADRHRAEIAKLLRGQAPDAGGSFLSQVPELRFRIIDELTDLLERESLRDPVLLAIDNLHWADPATLLALHTLTKRLDRLPIAIVLAHRPVGLAPNLRLLLETLAARDALAIALGPLEDDAVAALIEQHAGAPPGPRLMERVASCGGNPFFISELIRALADEGAIELDGSAEVGRSGLPPSLRLIVVRRLSVLPGPTLEALQMASVLGTRFSLSDLAIALRKPANQILGDLEPALKEGVAGEAGAHLAFRHDLVRESLYEDLPASAREALHLQAGRAFAASGLPPERVAPHLARGASAGDAEALDWLLRAGREAAPRSPLAAIAILERAMDLTRPGDPERGPIQAELASSLRRAGRLHEAERVIRDLLERTPDPAVAISLRLTLSEALEYQGRIPEALEQVEAALREPVESAQLRARILSRLALSKLLSGDPAGSRAAGEEALALAERSGDALASCEALCALAFVATWSGHWAMGADLATRAVGVAERDPTGTAALFHPWGYQGVALLFADRLDEAREATRTNIRRAEDTGAAGDLTLSHATLAMEEFLAGNWDEMLAEVETALSLAEETGTRATSALLHALRALVGIHRNDLAGAAASLDAADRELSTPGSIQINAQFAMLARALFFEASGDEASALAVVGAAWDLMAALGLLGEYRFLGPHLVRLALAAGERDRAASATESVEELAQGAKVATATGAALLCRGMLDDDLQALLAAVDAYRQGPRPIELAHACGEAGLRLGRAGARDDAVRLLEEAITGFERVGAVRDVARLDAALRHLGVRRGRRGSRRRPTTGWASLTPAEEQVARLAAEGLTNAEIGERLYVSRRTVETHLSHLFQKLGLASRVQLAAEVARAPA